MSRKAKPLVVGKWTLVHRLWEDDDDSCRPAIETLATGKGLRWYAWATDGFAVEAGSGLASNEDAATTAATAALRAYYA